MKQISITAILLLLICSAITLSCEKLVEIESPSDKLTGTVVFSNDQTAISAMEGIYNELFQADFSSGSRSSVTVLAGLSSDNVQYLNSGNIDMIQFEKHDIDPINPINLQLWSSAYNIIYLCNSLIEGLEQSNSVKEDLQLQLEGEARFVRAFTYFQLVNLYGGVPLVLTTDYMENSLKPRATAMEVYQVIEEDLLFSSQNLNSSYRNQERTSVNEFVAKAFLARFYLYLEDWQKADAYSSEVINASDTYRILDNLNEVFLANSQEAIWQISPKGGGNIASNTNDGSMFIIDPFFSFFSTLKLDNSLATSFKEQDLRYQNWVGFNEAKNAYFAFKYKIRTSSQFPIVEYSMVLRLAEQYLIRAEARTRMGLYQDAISDLDVIRLRAGLSSIPEINTDITEQELLEEILIQRRKELFTEWGHRWFDLKRTGEVGNLFKSDPGWKKTDVLYPIPSEEISKNPNITQNDGY